MNYELVVMNFEEKKFGNMEQNLYLSKRKIIILELLKPT